ncbi:MAG: tRNA (adenosine(37)-N6)-dimethylallyltransferase MiaA [Deltaproteobacteria bacterium]
MRKRPRVVFIAGPTASGKSAVAQRLAALAPCTLISADAMQVYKGMDIVTDKPDRAARRRFRHALIDTVPPTKEYNAAVFCRAARRAIRTALRAKRCPVVVGGTGLYIRSLIEGLFEGPGADAGVRRRLEGEALRKGPDELWERLRRVDPLSAARIGRGPVRRLIRALEVYELTKRPLSELQGRSAGIARDYDVRLFVLRRSREDLYARIDRRVDEMMERGLIGEVRGLLKKRLSRTARGCIGIPEVEGYLEGRYDTAEAVRLIKRNTRHFAKRQMTWFRREKGAVWLDVAADADLTRAAGRILSALK